MKKETTLENILPGFNCDKYCGIDRIAQNALMGPWNETIRKLRGIVRSREIFPAKAAATDALAPYWHSFVELDWVGQVAQALCLTPKTANPLFQHQVVNTKEPSNDDDTIIWQHSSQTHLSKK
jgi:hypothetical protein